MAVKVGITLTFGHEAWWLEAKGDITMSPEEFISGLEAGLESGELDIEDVRNVIEDYHRRQR